jgi:hypothetical protein
MDATPQDDESVVGDECHIVSREPNGPRYDPGFPLEDIDSYQNLILLCKVHHKMVDDQAETFTASILRQLRGNHEAWVSRALESAVVSSGFLDPYEGSFGKVKASMPKLIAEMRADLKKEGHEFTREFFIVSKTSVLTVGNPCFKYYFEDHDNLQGKIHVLENHGFVHDVTPGNTKKYRMTEGFVELVLGT